MSAPERDNQIKPYRVPVEFAAPGIGTEKSKNEFSGADSSEGGNVGEEATR